MATGVGKTKLLGRLNRLPRANGYSRNFFVIAPGETIYAKLIRELTPSEPGYLFGASAGWRTSGSSPARTTSTASP